MKNNNSVVHFVSILYHYDENHIAAWRDFPAPIILYVPEEHFSTVNQILTPNATVQIYITPPYESMPWYFRGENPLQLPSVRNGEKDTIHYIWHTHQKIFCLHQAMENCDFNVGAYLDFHAPYELINDSSTLEFIDKTLGFNQKHQLYIQHRDSMYIPGCWGTPDDIHHDDFMNNVHWRFCGSFLFGSKRAIQRMYEQYNKHFISYLREHNFMLFWDVNFWACIEKLDEDWKPIWYAANHDDTLITSLPNVFQYYTLSKIEDYKEQIYDYPNYSPYRPMSASSIEHGGKHYLNTRYVNYWIYNHGMYYYPDDDPTIRTLNVCSILHPNNHIPLTYNQMELETTIPNHPDAFSEGIEDIRLYKSCKDDICFIGSTLQYSLTGNISMIHGLYDVDSKKYYNTRIIDSPYDSWCEKNWAPIPLPDNTDGFVYKWFPLEIGRLEEDPSDDHKSRLNILYRNPMHPWFSKMRGSTPFITYLDHLLAVVHFSYDNTPRQYFHQLVMINRENMTYMESSPVFCFRNIGVEFCIGFCIVEKSKLFGFWISQMDRDPMYIEIPISVLMNGKKTCMIE
jgi:hypothetical protein